MLLYKWLVRPIHLTPQLLPSWKLYGWGSNLYGEVGNSTYNNYIDPPVLLNHTQRWKYINTYMNCTSALDENNTLYVWGSNINGMFGTGVNWNVMATPTPVDNTYTWKQVSFGVNHTMVISTDDKLYGWGTNDYGQLGNGKTDANSEEYLSLIHI